MSNASAPCAKAVELVSRDTVMAPRGPDRAQLALADPLLDGHQGHLARRRHVSRGEEALRGRWRLFHWLRLLHIGETRSYGGMRARRPGSAFRDAGFYRTLRGVRASVGRLGLLLIGFVLALVAAEGLVRWLALAPPPPPSHRNYYRVDTEMGYDIVPHFPPTREEREDGTTREMWSNELGCYDTSAHPRTPYVLLIGDSFAHGSTRFEDNWGTVVESRLGRRVLKCGIPGSGTRHQLVKARRIIAHMQAPPDLIILGWFPNDLEDDVLFPRATVLDGWQVTARRLADRDTGAIETHDAPTMQARLEAFERGRTCTMPGVLQRARCGLASRSRLVAMFGEALRRLATRFPGAAKPLQRAGVLSATPQEPTVPLAFVSTASRPWLQQAWQRHLESIAMFDALAREQQAPFLVVLFPANFQVYPFLAAGHRVEVERPHDIVAGFLQARGVAHLDLLPVLRAHANRSPRARLDPVRDLYYRVDFHLSRRGNVLSGLAVAEYIADRKLLPVAEALPRLREELARFRTAAPS
jgi:hypothetical protein